jgi:hypothetical protein
MKSIADVLALTPGPSWHESIAIVQEIAATLQPGQPLPGPEDLLLEADGTITFGFAGESARPQVADLASLLKSLLEKTDAPKALRELADENARDEPAHATIASFTKALAFYERPNRRGDLQALGGRLEGRSQAMQAERSFAELRERVARKSEEESPVQAAPVAAKPSDRARNIARARAMAIAAAVVLAAGAVSAMTVLRGWNRESPHGTLQAASAAAPLADDSAVKATDAAPGTEHAVSTGSRIADHHRPVGTSAATRDVARPSNQSAVRPRRSPSDSPGLARIGLKPVHPLPEPRPAAPASVARSASASDTGSSARAIDVPTVRTEAPVYSPANGDVTPPVWIRRQLPTEPSPDSRTGYFEIVIDTNGDVESVRLDSPTRRYEERMLVAAAKAWKFRPALLDGQPVRYQMRVPITLTWTIDR